MKRSNKTSTSRPPWPYEVQAAVRRYRAGGAGPKVTLLVLSEHLGLHGEEWSCWPGVKTLAEQSEQSEGAVRRHLATFEKRGLISKVRRGREGGGRDTDAYVLNLAAIGLDQSAHDARIDTEEQSAHPEGAKRASERGQSAHPTNPDPLIEQQENDEERPESDDSPPSSSESSSSKQQRRARAEEIVNDWWEERKAGGNPVGQKWLACRAVVEAMLSNGVAENRIAWALRNSPVCSTGALEMAIQRRLQKHGEKSNHSSNMDALRGALLRDIDR